MRWLAILAICLPAFGQSGSGAGANMQCVERLEMPLYPLLAREARIQGSVTVAATPASNGSVSVEAGGAHPILVQAAETAIRGSAFRKDCVGKSVGVIISFVIDGKLQPQNRQWVSFSYPNRFSITVPPPLKIVDY